MEHGLILHTVEPSVPGATLRQGAMVGGGRTLHLGDGSLPEEPSRGDAPDKPKSADERTRACTNERPQRSRQ